MGQARNTTPDGAIHMPNSGWVLYKIDDAATLLRVSRRTVFRMIAAGKLAVVSLSDRGTRITGESLRALVKHGRAAIVRVELAQAQPATLGLLNKLAVEHADEHGPEKVWALLAKFGVKSLGDVPAERRAEFRDRLLKL